jgi:hypothetical protein
MAGFEVVVRPVVFPDIRPQPARSLPPADDPEQGFCTIHGNPASIGNASFSYSINTSKSKSVETERRVDTARVYQKDDDGKVNRDNFIDLDVPNKIKSRGGKQPAANSNLKPDGKPNYGGQMTHGDLLVNYYKRIKEADNIEILERDIIKKNTEDQAGGGE